jgi:hypothetical protein
MSVGYIYILSNPAMPGLLKIGFTNRDVKERVGELTAATGVPKPFEIEYYCLTGDVEEIEGIVHRHFTSKRVSGREFFLVAPFEAVELIDSLIKKVEADRFCRATAEPLDSKPLGPNDRLCVECGTLNRDVRPVGLDRERICKKCGHLLGWGGS